MIPSFVKYHFYKFHFELLCLLNPTLTCPNFPLKIFLIGRYRYSTDYGMFHLCIADSEHDWREGSEQYKFIENCLASADRQKQPWLIFAAHRVLGYSSLYWEDGSFGEPMGRESLQKLWQKYKVDIAFFGHVHNYERTCPIYQVRNNRNLSCFE